MTTHRKPPEVAHFDDLPDSAMVSDKVIAQLLGKHRNSVWRDAKEGRLPAPIRIGPATTRWHVGALRRHLASLVESA